ncbi:uncharacterized protein CEXT_331051 [Caerostris extrusa]|uniref:Uncharacterized protein n=1 Tax=Caerostris extrusa TaxID=172846 RepID=A0AAV4V8B5_CAEEX|nr:uncharacterized protein CEXT_331051 [Caerostris extrusa]
MDCEKVRACARALRQHIEELNARITKSPKKRQSPPPPPPEEEEEMPPIYDYIPTAKQVEEERNHQLMLKRRIRKALMEELAPEIKKLRTVDGTQDDLIKLWNQSDPNAPAKPAKKDKGEEFDYEEIGAAAGDLSSGDPYTTNDHTVAPSDGYMKKRQSGDESTTQEIDGYEDGDELVRELFEIRVQYVATKSINGDEEDGLVTSTFVPF